LDTFFAVTMAAEINYDGILFVEISKTYHEMYCAISGSKFQAFKKEDTSLPASITNKSEVAVEVRNLSNQPYLFLTATMTLNIVQHHYG